MQFVEPIRDKRKIAQIKNQLRGEGRYRDLLLFTVGINTALRVSDLVKLRIGDIGFLAADGSFQLLENFYIHEQKTDKMRQVTINEAMTTAFQEYCMAYAGICDNPNNNFLFFNVKHMDYSDPIKRGMVWLVLSDICKDVGLKGNYGAHTLRKTWGYHARMSGVPLSHIMKILNHSSEETTLRYLGITADELAAVARNLTL